MNARHSLTAQPLLSRERSNFQQVAARGRTAGRWRTAGLDEEVRSMRNGFIGSIITVAVFAVGPIRVAAQVSTPPRTPDWKRNLQRVCHVLNTAAWHIRDHHAQHG